MTPLQRVGLAAYLKNYSMLVDASRFLAARAQVQGVYRVLLWTLNWSLLARFYRACRVSRSAAEARVLRASTILRARCICAPSAEPDSAGSCYYLDEAAEAYHRHGPLPEVRVEPRETLADFERHARAGDAWWMTVVGPSPCVAFPREYVLCCCREKHCLVSSHARRFPWLGIVSANPEDGAPASSARVVLDHVVALVIGLPSLIGWIGAYRVARGGARARCWVSVAMLVALSCVGGVIIAQPPMWRYLHWPRWHYNQYFALLLPVAALLEVVVLTGIGELGRRLARRSEGVAAATRVVLASMIPFQLVHVLRFLSVSLLTDVVPEAVTRTLFWAWDPVAYGVLAYALVRFRWFGTTGGR